MSEEYLRIEEFKRVKTFMSAMTLFELTLKQKQKHLSDKRLSQAEKTILECAILMKDCEFKKIILRLVDLPTQNILVESQRCLVLGMAYNHGGTADQALVYLKKAQSIFEQYALHAYDFNALLHLFFCHLNLKNPVELPPILEKMQNLLSDNEKEKISFLRCCFNYYAHIGHYEKAKKNLKELEKLRKQMHPSQEILHLTDKFIYFVKTDQFQLCEETLEEMKDLRRYHLSANYRFMKNLLHHYLYQEPIYLYDKDFVEFPILFSQLKVLIHLESGDTEQAKVFWDRLHQISPQAYGSFMNYQGDKCLFSLCLSLYEDTQEPLDLSRFQLQPREKAVLQMLQESKNPVKKEELFLKVWGKELQSKDEMFKLSMMITRLKQKTGLEIKSRKGCYLLAPKPQRKVA